MSYSTLPASRTVNPMNHEVAVAVLSAFVLAVNSGHHLSDDGRSLAAEAIAVLERERVCG